VAIVGRRSIANILAASRFKLEVCEGAAFPLLGLQSIKAPMSRRAGNRVAANHFKTEASMMSRRSSDGLLKIIEDWDERRPARAQ